MFDSYNEDANYDYSTVNITISNGTAIAEEDVRLPDGELVGIATVTSPEPSEILNMGLFINNQEVLKPADVRFSQKTNGGTWRDSIRPVSGIQGGTTVTTRIIALTDVRADDITTQVLFVVKKPNR